MPRRCGCHSHNGFLLSPEGLAQREVGFGAQFALGLTGDAEGVRLDKSGRVTGSGPDEIIFDDSVIEEQFLRQEIHNGS